MECLQDVPSAFCGPTCATPHEVIDVELAKRADRTCLESYTIERTFTSGVVCTHAGLHLLQAVSVASTPGHVFECPRPLTSTYSQRVDKSRA